MKVFTLTTQFANNYGALLQCYALSKYLNSQNDIDCQVIDYLPEGYDRSWKLLVKPKSLKGFIKIIYSFLKISYIFDKKAKNKKMKAFIKDYLPLTEKSYKREEIIINPPIADAYICGSDQIWNQIIFKDLTYYLDFVDLTKGKRIAYAASVADPWRKEFEDYISESLHKFDAISIREKGNMSQVQSVVPDKKVSWVIDPVFLLGREEWDKIITTPAINEPYIFCYFLNTSSFAVKVVNKLREITGYKIVNFSVDPITKYRCDYNLRRTDPRDFVGFIKNASYICTNSFHCSAFSIIYEKKFAFIPKTWANERVLSLQEIFGIDVIMTKEKYRDFSTKLFDIDYSSGKENGEAFINSSKEFLTRALYEQY